MKFSIDTDELDRRITEMARFERGLERRLADLDKAIADLHVTWIGDAAVAHRKAHADWTRGAEEMKRALVALRQAAAIAHRNYESAVDANRRMWESVQ